MAVASCLLRLLVTRFPGLALWAMGVIQYNPLAVVSSGRLVHIPTVLDADIVALTGVPLTKLQEDSSPYHTMKGARCISVILGCSAVALSSKKAGAEEELVDTLD